MSDAREKLKPHHGKKGKHRPAKSKSRRQLFHEQPLNEEHPTTRADDLQQPAAKRKHLPEYVACKISNRPHRSRQQLCENIERLARAILKKLKYELENNNRGARTLILFNKVLRRGIKEQWEVELHGIVEKTSSTGSTKRPRDSLESNLADDFYYHESGSDDLSDDSEDEEDDSDLQFTDLVTFWHELTTDMIVTRICHTIQTNVDDHHIWEHVGLKATDFQEITPLDFIIDMDPIYDMMPERDITFENYIQAALEYSERIHGCNPDSNASNDNTTTNQVVNQHRDNSSSMPTTSNQPPIIDLTLSDEEDPINTDENEIHLDLLKQMPGSGLCNKMLDSDEESDYELRYLPKPMIKPKLKDSPMLSHRYYPKESPKLRRIREMHVANINAHRSSVHQRAFPNTKPQADKNSSLSAFIRLIDEPHSDLK